MATLGDPSMPYRNFIPRAAVAVAAFLLGGAILVNKLRRFAPGRAAAAQARQAQPLAAEAYECRRILGEITIDGHANEDARRQAATIERVQVHWLSRPARSRTRARLLFIHK